MKKAFSYAILLLATLLFAGCEEWLDVRLKSKVKSDDLLSSEQGFEDALVGVYSKLIGEELYGRQLTYGFFETLVGNYDLSASNNTVYADVAKGSLSATNVRSVTDGFWNGLYNAIANLNNILDQIDGHRNLFTGNRYAIIKGEALGLRAFLHLELFKIFGDFSDLDAAAIPYVATLTKNPVPDSSGREVIARAIEELEQAEALLRDADPVCQGTFSVEGDIFLGDRHLRMNYYAVRALQARALLWSGDKQKAYTAATQLIADCSESFPWIASEKLSGTDERQCDYSFSTEHLFALNVFNLENLYEKWLAKEAADIQILSKGYYYFEQWYEAGGVGATDYRKLYITEKAMIGSSQNYIVKRFYQPEGYNSDYAARIPLFRLSELYYIAAECKVGTDNGEACSLLNTVRQHRGITVDLDAGSLDDVGVMSAVRHEYLKEFWGEGQFYFLCKRHAWIPDGTMARYLTYSLSGVFAIERPDLETEYNQ